MHLYRDDFVDVVQETFKEVTGSFVNKRVSAILIDVFAEAIKKSLSEGNDVTIRGFGTFEVRTREEKIYTNPNNHDELITKPATIYPAFRAGKELTRAVKGVKENENI